MMVAIGWGLEDCGDYLQTMRDRYPRYNLAFAGKRRVLVILIVFSPCEVCNALVGLIWILLQRLC